MLIASSFNLITRVELCIKNIDPISYQCRTILDPLLSENIIYWRDNYQLHQMWYFQRTPLPHNTLLFVQVSLPFCSGFTLPFYREYTLFTAISLTYWSQVEALLVCFLYQIVHLLIWSTLAPLTNMERLLVVFQMFRSWTLVPQQIPAETVSAEKCCSCVLLFSTIHQVPQYIPKTM